MAGVDNVTITSGGTGRLFLVNSSKAYLRIGGDGNRLIIDGDNRSYGSGFISFEIDIDNSLKNSLTNVTIQNVTATASDGYVIQRKNSGLTGEIFKNVTFNNCSVTGNGGSEAIVKFLRGNNLYLDGTINFESCNGTSFYMGAVNSKLRGPSTPENLTLSNPITITVNWATFKNYDSSNSLLVLFNTTNAGKVTVKNGVLQRRDATTDWKVWQAYKLSVSAANAATLVLPFESTIPDGASCYTLSYSSGNDVTATTVETTLPANTPVLVMAAGSAEGTEYVFRTTASANTAFGNGSEAVTVDNMTGVFSKTAVTQSSGGKTNYILQNGTFGLGFYKIGGSGHSVGANRAYLNIPGSSSARGFGIDFGDGTTGIRIVNQDADAPSKFNDGKIYNLAGVQVDENNLTKGIYIKNGKKFIVK